MKLVRITKGLLPSPWAKYIWRLALLISSEQGLERVVFSDSAELIIPEYQTTVIGFSNINQFMIDQTKEELYGHEVVKRWKSSQVWKLEHDPKYIFGISLNDPIVSEFKTKIALLDQDIKKLEQYIRLCESIIQDGEDEVALKEAYKMYQAKSKRDFFGAEIPNFSIGIQKELFEI